ncbi:MAG: Xaa-Pro peptidase family protein [Chloroflexi bacterium]|nr:Xaa-Pro peptidase family protein [Chloroflexota bacterium]
MKELMFPDFPRAEFVARYERTQQAMKRHGLDALYLTQRQNLRYFAGLRDGAWDAYHFYFLTILPSEGAPILLVANGFNHLVKQCWIEDVRYWPWAKAFYMAKESNAVQLTIDVLKEKRLDSSVIGMELGPDIHPHMGQVHFDGLRAGLPRAKIVDGSDAVWDVRCVKSPAEIDRMRRAARISTKGVKAGFEALKPGMTEQKVMAVMTSVMCAEGASELRFNALYAGPRAMWADGMPTNYTIEPGDLVQFDGGCLYEGYWCDYKRMAAVGEPRADQRRFYELAKQGLFAAIAAMKPGVPMNVPLQAAFGVNDDAGFSSFSAWCLENGWSAIGHCLGQDVHEQPGLSATNTALLKENMVLSVEPYITLDGVYPFWAATEKFGLEDVVLVTRDGVEILTPEDQISHELWVVSP